jgi:PAS domain S-box-containing protein
MTKMRVLVVEDELIVAEDIRAKLERLGYRVAAVVGSGAEAVQAAAEMEPDLALVDIGLPGEMDGIEAAEEIHGQLDIPVIYLTAHSDENTLARARITGPFGYILKPFDARELRSTLEMALYWHEQEQRFRKSEARYRDLYENAPNAYLSVGTDGLIRRCNRRASELLGFPREELVGRLVFELYADTAQGKIKAKRLFQQFLADGQVRDEELQIQRADGTLLWVSLTVNPIRDAGGQVMEGHSVLVDITARKEAEEKLVRRAAQLELLNDIGGQVAATLHLDSVLTQAARLVQRRFGYHHVAVFTVDRQQQELVMRASAGDLGHLFPQGHRLALGQGMVGWVGEHGQMLLANDVEAEPRYVNLYPDVLATRAELSMPIQVAGRVLGVLDVQSPQRNVFDENDVLVIKTLADQIAVAIENARLYEATQRELAERKRAEQALQELNLTLEEHVRHRTSELQVLHELTKEIGYTLNYDDLFRLILQHLSRLSRFDIAASLFVDHGVGQIFLWPLRPVDDRLLEEVKAQVLEAYEELAGTNCPKDEVIVRLHRPDAFDPALPVLSDLAHHIQVPISVGDRAAGLLYIGSEEERDLDYDDLRLLYTLSNQAADSIQRLRALLAKERQRLEHLVEHLPDGILLVDAESHTTLSNPAAAEILSLLGTDEGGGGPTQIGPYSLEKVLREGTGPIPLTITLEHPVSRAFEVSAQAIPADQPEERGAVVVLRDVTEARRMEKQMEQQDRLAAVGQLAGGIAHDFNNILTTIILYSQVALRQKAALPPQVNQGLEAILDSGRRAADLVRQILDFSRHSEMETQALDLRTYIEGVMNVLGRTLPENIFISLDKGVGQCTVKADPTRIQQVLMNLVVNARDAMPKGGTLRVALSTLNTRPGEQPPVLSMPPGRWACLSVTDTGTGILPEVAAHLFEPFFTTKPRGRGTGLGLAQVYGIVAQHKGYIGLETEVGKGSTFTVYLPVYENRKGAELPQKQKEELPVHPRGPARTILLVEDEQQIRELGQALIEELGHRVLVAADGQQALEAFRLAGRVDLVITDMVMPQMGGKDLIEELRLIEPHLKAVAISGYALPDDMEELKRTGIVGIVQKPFDEHTLAQVIRRALE